VLSICTVPALAYQGVSALPSKPGLRTWFEGGLVGLVGASEFDGEIVGGFVGDEVRWSVGLVEGRLVGLVEGKFVVGGGVDDFVGDRVVGRLVGMVVGSELGVVVSAFTNSMEKSSTENSTPLAGPSTFNLAEVIVPDTSTVRYPSTKVQLLSLIALVNPLQFGLPSSLNLRVNLRLSLAAFFNLAQHDT